MSVVYPVSEESNSCKHRFCFIRTSFVQDSLCLDFRTTAINVVWVTLVLSYSGTHLKIHELYHLKPQCHFTAVTALLRVMMSLSMTAIIPSKSWAFHMTVSSKFIQESIILAHILHCLCFSETASSFLKEFVYATKIFITEYKYGDRLFNWSRKGEKRIKWVNLQ